jgi:hypothetical protein
METKNTNIIPNNQKHAALYINFGKNIAANYESIHYSSK